MSAELALLDERPIELDGFTLTAVGVRTAGRPPFAKFWAALQFSMAVQDASPYWVGDLLNYAESRPDYEQKLQQAIEATGYKLKTLTNLQGVCRRVDVATRALAPSPGHADAVSALPPADQRKLLTQAQDDGLGVRELRLAVKASTRRRVINGQARLDGQYRVVYADPPWAYGNRQPSGTGAGEQYPTLSVDAICDLPVMAHVADDAVLFLWSTAPMLLERPGPREVMEAWGFTPKTGMVWDKVDHNFGNYVSVRHEHLLIGTRGSCTPDRPVPMPDSVVTERKRGHSEKPEVFRAAVEKLYDGPYLELFGRHPVDGWSVFGNDAALWE